MKRVSLVFTLAIASAFSIEAATAQTLKTVKDRGMLSCGVGQGLPGFSSPDDKGNWTGLDVDVCRAVAAAVLNDPTKVKFVPLSAKDRFTALQSGEIDVLSRNTTWTLSRDTSLGANFTGVTYYDGQGFMVKKSLKVNSALELNSASVCVQTGTTTEQNLADYFKGNNMKYEVIAFGTNDEAVKAYESGRCDVFTTDVSGLYADRLKLANAADHVVLPEVISKEPLGPMVRHGDDQWFDIVKWTLFAMVTAEELGITQKNVDEMAKSTKPETEAGVRDRWESRRTAWPYQGLGLADREGRRQLRRNLRSQRRRRLQARHRPGYQRSSGTRAEFSTRRRSADRQPRGCGDGHRAPKTSAAVCRQTAAGARRPRGVGRVRRPDPVRRRAGLDRLRNRRQCPRQSADAADHRRIRLHGEYGRF